MAKMTSSLALVPSTFLGDDYPRAGVILCIDLADPHWSCAAYMPGSQPGGRAGFIESCGGKNFGSLDVFIKGFVAGEDRRLLSTKMRRAEQAYAGSLSSNDSVTV